MMNKVVVQVLGLLFVFGFMACKKDTASASKTALEASKTISIAKGEPVLFTLPQAALGNIVNWSVSPSANTQINASGDSASILFGSKGNYTVTAVSGSLKATSSVSVTDSIYNGGGGGTQATTLPLLSIEVIDITVSRIDSGSTSGLLFSAQTTNSYTCASNSLISETTAATSSYTIDYSGVSVPAGCTTGTAKAGGFNYLYPISSGSNTLTIVVNGTTYTGAIVKSGNSYDISWPNSSGATISPKSL